MYPPGLAGPRPGPADRLRPHGAGRHLPGRGGPRRAGAAPAPARRRGRRRGARRRRAADRLRPRRRRASARRCPSLLAVGAVHHRAGRGAAAHPPPRSPTPTSPRHPLLRVPARLRRRRDLPAARAGDDRRAGRQRAHRARQPLARARPRTAQRAAEDGVLKIMSKMGISTLDSYRGGADLRGRRPGRRRRSSSCFAGTPSPLGGIGFDELADDVLARHAPAFGDEARPREPRLLQAPPRRRLPRHQPRGGRGAPARRRPGGRPGAAGRRRAGRPARGQLADLRAAHLLQRATERGPLRAYERFAELVNDAAAGRAARPAGAGRRPRRRSPLDEVEPATAIAQRFSTGAMSPRRARRRRPTRRWPMAMNLIGGRSNSGEGGEDPARFRRRGARATANSKVKQVASGRFGVTPEYLAYADELQIKMAQGSKPGEGGQLPGHKVSHEIARLRHTQPGVALISPAAAPRHLLDRGPGAADLRPQAGQPHADVSREAGRRAPASARSPPAWPRACADVVRSPAPTAAPALSPLSSIKHAGLPWELGLAETQQTLVRNGLRSRVRVPGRRRLQDRPRRDGRRAARRRRVRLRHRGAARRGLHHGPHLPPRHLPGRHRHPAPGAAREVHAARPEMVATYLCFVAEEVRALPRRARAALAGRGDRPRRPAAPARVDDARAADRSTSRRCCTTCAPSGRRRRCRSRTATSAGDPAPRSALGDRVFDDACPRCADGTGAEPALPDQQRRPHGRRAPGRRDRAPSSATRPPGGPVRVRFEGEAGQSFGAFLRRRRRVPPHRRGQRLRRQGHGRRPDRHPPARRADDAGAPVLIGNTVLYGATGGELFCAGRAGERFARPQLRRHRGGRGRRRPRLRVHDRRHGRRARPGRAQPRRRA